MTPEQLGAAHVGRSLTDLTFCVHILQGQTEPYAQGWWLGVVYREALKVHERGVAASDILLILDWALLISAPIQLCSRCKKPESAHVRTCHEFTLTERYMTGAEFLAAAPAIDEETARAILAARESEGCPP